MPKYGPKPKPKPPEDSGPAAVADLFEVPAGLEEIDEARGEVHGPCGAYDEGADEEDEGLDTELLEELIFQIFGHMDEPSVLDHAGGDGSDIESPAGAAIPPGPPGPLVLVPTVIRSPAKHIL